MEEKAEPRISILLILFTTFFLWVSIIVFVSEVRQFIAQHSQASEVSHVQSH